MVRVGEECPRISCTTFMGTPAWAMCEAAAWRRSWNRTRGKPVLSMIRAEVPPHEVVRVEGFPVR